MLDRTEVAPGVTRRQESSFAIYTGTADALVLAGVVELGMLPGQPGNNRGMCCFDGDGTQRQRGSPARMPGYKQIVAKTSGRGTYYELRLLLSPERLEAIKAEKLKASGDWPFPVDGSSPGSTLVLQEARP